MRDTSIDLSRGITIFFMVIVNSYTTIKETYPFLLHKQWNGITPTDLVFPNFLFLVGLSMFISFGRQSQRLSKSEMMIKAVMRGSILFLLGLITTNFPLIHIDITDLRIMGVLQRIGFCYIIASFIVIYISHKPRTVLFTAISLPIVYHALMSIFGSEPIYGIENNFSGYIDSLIIGTSKEPYGLLSSLSATSTILFGYYYMGSKVDWKKMLIIAFLLLLVGWQISPLNHKLWTPSFLGLSLLTSIVLLQICKGFNGSQTGLISRVLGRNSLFCFVLSQILYRGLHFIPIGDTNGWYYIYRSLFRDTFGIFNASLTQALAMAFLVWLIAYILDRKSIYIKI